MKIAQDQVEDVVSHLSTDPAKATTLALLGEQVELLVGNGRPNTAKFLDAVEGKSLVSAHDASSLRLDYGVRKDRFTQSCFGVLTVFLVVDVWRRTETTTPSVEEWTASGPRQARARPRGYYYLVR